MKRTIFEFVGGAVALCILGIASACMEQAVQSADPGDGPPILEVDPFWPQPLPNHWILGSVIGVSVDSRDHVWVIHRQDTFDERTEINAVADPPTAECCAPAPPVLEFDQDGNLVGSWGGPSAEYDWPQSNHGITVDHMDNVWIGGNGENDSHLLKFTRTGDLLLQLGEPFMRSGSNDPENFWRVAEVNIDAEANEVYVADGYGNKRVAVLDAQTGKMKRYWGAYGNVPDDSPIPAYTPDAPPAQQFRSPLHCAELSRDGLVYACDRASDRIQVFQPDGTFIREAFIAPETLGSGSVWDIAFSHDPEQHFIYLADGSNKKVHVLDRESLEVVSTFGGGGRQAGQFYGVHSIAVDSRGNVYTTETYEGKRVQKFVFRGFGAAGRGVQGPSWPSIEGR
jgi:DNA-binding beta-propeller fold protein YncE